VAFSPEGLDPAFAGQFAQIRKAFVLGLTKRLNDIQGADSPSDLHAALHRLAGSAGAYGFEALGLLARSAMQACERNDEDCLATVLEELQRTVQQIQENHG
jgi:HPt (histidine-containing phosphotransfer) domain-containing protein